MSKKVVAVPQLAWHEPQELKLRFPASWEVETLNMTGFDRPALQVEQIRHTLTNPVYGPPIRELAGSKKGIVECYRIERWTVLDAGQRSYITTPTDCRGK